MSYLKKPSLYNTGFLPYTAITRLKQDLPPQELSNVCQYVEKNYKSKLYKSSITGLGGTCNQTTMYPFYAVPLPK